MLKVTDDKVCLKFKTDQSQDVKKMTELNNLFMRLSCSAEVTAERASQIVVELAEEAAAKTAAEAEAAAKAAAAKAAKDAAAPAGGAEGVASSAGGVGIRRKNVDRRAWRRGKFNFRPVATSPPPHTPHLRRREGETLGLVRGGHSSRNAYDGAGAVGAAGTVDTIASSHDFS